MSVPTSAELLAFLQKHEFLTPPQVQQVRGGLGTKFADAQALARELVARNWLTPYQVAHLLQGNGPDLLLGPYRILDQLGEGGMGEVLKAFHPGMDRIIALKVIAKDRVSDPTAIARFQREVKAVAKLSHRNIVTAFDVNQVGQRPYMAMEYVEGIDLSRLVRQSGPLPIARACDYIRQAALGLQHAHEKGLVHRDIKPGNLVVARPHPDEPPIIKILDFGLARFASESPTKNRLTQLGHVVGTVDYIAPEQAQNPLTADIRADIYSLGCALFYLLTGNAPFGGNDAAEKITARVLGDAPPVCQSRPEVSAVLDGVVAKMMARNPGDRYQTPGEVAKALEPHTTEDSQNAPAPTPEKAPTHSPKPAQQDMPNTMDSPSQSGGKSQAGGKQPRPAKTLTAEQRVLLNEKTLLPTAPPQPPKAARRKQSDPIIVLRKTKDKPAKGGRAWMAIAIGIAAVVTVACASGSGIVFFLPGLMGRVNATPPQISLGPTAGTEPNVTRPTAPPTSPATPGTAPKTPIPPKPAPPMQEPARLKAPFKEKEAKDAQEAWAKYLGRNVEEEIDLGGGVKLVVVLIPPGTFMMGSPKEEKDRNPFKDFDAEKLHLVTITKPFYLGKDAVTQAQYEKVAGKNPSFFRPDGDRKNMVKGLDTTQFPVETVSWDEAEKFCTTGSKTVNWGTLVLPSEAQWEYACRAGTETPFSFGKELNGNQANCDGNFPYGTEKKGPFLGRPCAVLSYEANGFGLYQMHGNVHQWCADYYGPIEDLAEKDPVQLKIDATKNHVLRGGSWSIHIAWSCRAAYRFRLAADARDSRIGFRVAVRLD